MYNIFFLLFRCR